MANNKPRISFLIPHRWLIEPDRTYLGDNLRRKILGYFPDPEEAKDLRLIQQYYVKLICHAYKPVEISLTEKQLQLMLKPMFTNAKCLAVDWEYLQVKSKTVLAVFDFQLYF